MASNEHILSNPTEKFVYFSPGENGYSITTRQTFSIDTYTHLGSLPVSSPSVPPTPRDENRSNSFSINEETPLAPQASSSVSSFSTTSAFLALPLEIRRNIYFYALLPSAEYRQALRPLRAKWPNSWWGTEEMSRILRVNKQVHYETEEILYGSFKFSFLDTTPYNIQAFLGCLSPRARHLIRHISCSITMNGRIRDSIRQDYIENWKACLEVTCKEIPSLRKVTLQFRFLGGLATTNMKTTFVGSMMDLVSLFHGGQEILLLSYDGTSPVDKQGAEIVEDCREMIAQQLHS